MHEKIRTANRPLVCDVCGGMIQVGEPFRAVRDEYSPVEYHEHIQCPGSPAVAVSKPPRNRRKSQHSITTAIAWHNMGENTNVHNQFQRERSRTIDRL